jgi:hypothetical protein
MTVSRRALASAACLVALVCCACSGSAGGNELDGQASGAHSVLEFSVSAEGEIHEGANRFHVEVRRAESGEALRGGLVTGRATMRSMGHASPWEPVVQEIGDGVYRIDDVVFTMPGLWELHIQARADDDVYDEASFEYDVP